MSSTPRRARAAAPTACLLVLATGAARAESERPPPAEYAGPRSAPPEYVAEPAPPAPPLGHHGFQLAIRTGVAVPFGPANGSGAFDASTGAGSSRLKDLTGWQLPLIVDIGAKPIPQVFVGAYVGFGAGLAAGELARQCDDLHLDCRSTSFRLGAQVHYSTAPHDRVNPWLGYGLGFTWLTAGDTRQLTSLRGFDFAHLLAGVDFRVSRFFGIGPFIELTLGRYSHRHVETTTGTLDSDIGDRTFHEWLVIGPRFVFLP